MSCDSDDDSVEWVFGPEEVDSPLSQPTYSLLILVDLPLLRLEDKGHVSRGPEWLWLGLADLAGHREFAYRRE
ncbi:hypothetical protein SRHO_G00336040 [Serrasalmus rhombeus]